MYKKYVMSNVPTVPYQEACDRRTVGVPCMAKRLLDLV